jgi:shikimate dehydrogenase
MNASPAADRYAVIGYPVAHSRSPFIHAMFARQTGQNLTYERLEAPPQAFDRVTREFIAAGGRGLNVTVPHKEAAALLVDRLTRRAARAGAVNTIVVTPDGLLGDVTDGVGLVRDLRYNLGLDLLGARIRLVGAGGAARGVLEPLLAERPQRVDLVNRTVDRAARLAALFAADGNVRAGGLDAFAEETADLVINATSASLEDTVPYVPGFVVGAATVCYDMAYGPEGTAFTRWAAAAGAIRAVQGWGMLVEQAAESFELWRGVRPETAAVLRALQTA